MGAGKKKKSNFRTLSPQKIAGPSAEGPASDHLGLLLGILRHGNGQRATCLGVKAQTIQYIPEKGGSHLEGTQLLWMTAQPAAMHGPLAETAFTNLRSKTHQVADENKAYGATMVYRVALNPQMPWIYSLYSWGKKSIETFKGAWANLSQLVEFRWPGKGRQMWPHS